MTKCLNFQKIQNRCSEFSEFEFLENSENSEILRYARNDLNFRKFKDCPIKSGNDKMAEFSKTKNSQQLHKIDCRHDCWIFFDFPKYMLSSKRSDLS